MNSITNIGPDSDHLRYATEFVIKNRSLLLLGVCLGYVIGLLYGNEKHPIHYSYNFQLAISPSQEPFVSEKVQRLRDFVSIELVNLVYKAASPIPPALEPYNSKNFSEHLRIEHSPDSAVLNINLNMPRPMNIKTIAQATANAINKYFYIHEGTLEKTATYLGRYFVNGKKSILHKSTAIFGSMSGFFISTFIALIQSGLKISFRFPSFKITILLCLALCILMPVTPKIFADLRAKDQILLRAETQFVSAIAAQEKYKIDSESAWFDLFQDLKARLYSFKDDPKFHQVRFQPYYRYGKWLNDIKVLHATSKPENIIYADSLRNIGIEFSESYGLTNEEILRNLEVIDGLEEFRL